MTNRAIRIEVIGAVCGDGMSGTVDHRLAESGQGDYGIRNGRCGVLGAAILGWDMLQSLLAPEFSSSLSKIVMIVS